MQIDVQQAQEQLDELLEFVQAGQTVVICRDGRPVAELRAPVTEARTLRPIGLAKDACHVPPEFFDPLPDDLLDLFEGKGNSEST